MNGKKMNGKKMIPLVSAVLVVLGLYGTAFCGGGGLPGGCPSVLPQPTRGPFLYGTFTVAHDKSPCGLVPPSTGLVGYDVQLVLRHFEEVHLLSFFTSVGDRSLCSYTASELKDLFARTPCGYEAVGFGYPFGFDLADYTPVIFDLSILRRDCDPTRNEEMILGLVTIRLVPVK